MKTSSSVPFLNVRATDKSERVAVTIAVRALVILLHISETDDGRETLKLLNSFRLNLADHNVIGEHKSPKRSGFAIFRNSEIILIRIITRI